MKSACCDSLWSYISFLTVQLRILEKQFPGSELGEEQDPPLVPLPAPDGFQWPGGKRCGQSSGSGWSPRRLHCLRGSSIFSGSTASLVDTGPGQDTQESPWLEKGLLGKDKKQSTHFLQMRKFYFLTASSKIISIWPQHGYFCPAEIIIVNWWYILDPAPFCLWTYP